MELEGGRPAAEVFAGRDKILGTFFCRTTAHGMLSENPDSFFSRLADHFEADECFIKKTLSTLKYPFLLMAGTTGALITVLAFIVPEAVRTISGLSGKLPTVTRITLNALSSLQYSMPLLVIIIFLIACIWYLNRMFPWPEKLAQRIPFLGGFLLMISLRRVAVSISFLLSNGIGISEAFEISAEAEGRSLLRTKLLRAAQEIRGNKGLLITSLNDANGIFPPAVFGTSSNAQGHPPDGRLFRKIADFYEEKIEAGLTAAILIIEPAFVAIAGFVCGGILAALYLPLLQISNCR
jgi:type IV pilus assembly protein PilC